MAQDRELGQAMLTTATFFRSLPHLRRCRTRRTWIWGRSCCQMDDFRLTAHGSELCTFERRWLVYVVESLFDITTTQQQQLTACAKHIHSADTPCLSLSCFVFAVLVLVCLHVHTPMRLLAHEQVQCAGSVWLGEARLAIVRCRVGCWRVERACRPPQALTRSCRPR